MHDSINTQPCALLCTSKLTSKSKIRSKSDFFQCHGVKGGGDFAEELKQEKVLIIEEAPMSKLMMIVGVYTCKKFGRFGFKNFR